MSSARTLTRSSQPSIGHLYWTNSTSVSWYCFTIRPCSKKSSYFVGFTMGCQLPPGTQKSLGGVGPGGTRLRVWDFGALKDCPHLRRLAGHLNPRKGPGSQCDARRSAINRFLSTSPSPHHALTMAGLAEDVAGLVLEEAPSTWPLPTPRRGGITACSRASTRTANGRPWPRFGYHWRRRRRRRRRCGGWCGR